MFAAADAVLEAINSPAGRYAFVEMFVPDEEHEEPRPWSTRGPFTQRELMAATDFLARAGLLDDGGPV